MVKDVIGAALLCFSKSSPVTSLKEVFLGLLNYLSPCKIVLNFHFVKQFAIHH